MHSTKFCLQLLGIPLGRDEGEYAYADQLLLQGIPPGKLAYTIKFPGFYFRLHYFYFGASGCLATVTGLANMVAPDKTDYYFGRGTATVSQPGNTLNLQEEIPDVVHQ